MRNISHRSDILTLFPVSGAVWIGLGSVALLEAAYHWGRALRLYSLALFPAFSLCFMFVFIQTLGFLLQPPCLTAPWSPAMVDSHPFGPRRHNKLFPTSLLVTVFYTRSFQLQHQKVINTVPYPHNLLWKGQGEMLASDPQPPIMMFQVNSLVAQPFLRILDFVGHLPISVSWFSSMNSVWETQLARLYSITARTDTVGSKVSF